ALPILETNIVNHERTYRLTTRRRRGTDAQSRVVCGNGADQDTRGKGHAFHARWHFNRLLRHDDSIVSSREYQYARRTHVSGSAVGKRHAASYRKGDRRRQHRLDAPERWQCYPPEYPAVDGGAPPRSGEKGERGGRDRKSTRLNSSHVKIS